MSSPKNLNFYLGLVPRANGLSHQLFTAWSVWSPCSKTCGVGFRVRKRSCINPRLFPTGGLCTGLSIQHQSCFDRACPGKKTVSLSDCVSLSACLSLSLSVRLFGWLAGWRTVHLSVCSSRSVILMN